MTETVPVPERMDFLAGQPIHDPRDFLLELGGLQALAAGAEWDMDADEKAKLVTLRRGVHKHIREFKDACIFACLIEQVLQVRDDPSIRVKVAPPKELDNDADAYFLWDDRTGQRFAPIQLKELPPAHLNPDADLDDLLLKLRKYPPSRHRPIVAVHVNRTMHLATVTVPVGLNVASLWLFGSVTPDASRWGLGGDLLSEDAYRNLPLALHQVPRQPAG